jgi:hypothetical protein
MANNWGPRYIVPSTSIKTYSGRVLLREEYDEEILQKELQEMNFKGRIAGINNPWYYRKKGDETWIMIGESRDQQRYFPVNWDTTGLTDGQYEIMGLMHVFIEDDGDNKGRAIARENIVEVTVKN